MRHKVKGRTLGRNASHRQAMFRNMAASLIKTVTRPVEDEDGVVMPGRIVTTVPKAKELRPFVERLVTIAKRALPHEQRAQQFATTAARGTTEWKEWRQSEQWQQWVNAMAPAVTARRRAFSMLRDKEAVKILFERLAPRFESRNGGYTRIVRLAKVRLGDAGQLALIEFVGERDRVPRQRTAAPLVVEEPAADTPSPEGASENAPPAEAPRASAEPSSAEQPPEGQA